MWKKWIAGEKGKEGRREGGKEGTGEQGKVGRNKETVARIAS
jgi:hypothetical protein